MGEKPFRTDDDIIVTKLLVGTSSGSIVEKRNDNESWSSNATYVPSAAHLQNKISSGGPTAGPETKMASRKEHSSYTIRGINYQQQGNYSSIWYGQLTKRAEAFPIYIHQDVWIQGCQGGGKRMDATYGGIAHSRYFCFYSASGWSGTYRNFPDERKGWMKVEIPSGNANSWYNWNSTQLDSGSDSRTFNAAGTNVSKFQLTKGWYWLIMVNDIEIYDANDNPSTSKGYGLHASGQIYLDDAAWRGPYQDTAGNVVGLISTASAWSPSTASTFTPPATITASNWTEWDLKSTGDNPTPGFWHPRILLYGADS